MPYLTIGADQVYVESHGAGEPLVLLHGGFCSLEVLRPLGDRLARRFTVHAAERTGHGRTADRPGPFHYATMLGQTLAVLDALAVGPAHLVGFSDGAIIGLLLARDHPRRVRSLTAISGNIDTAAFVPDDYPYEVMPEQAQAQVRAEYDALSPDGPAHGDVVLAKLLALWQAEPDIPAASLRGIAAPTLVLGGEHDAIRHDHLATIAAAIPGATLAIVPGTTHMLARERPDAVADLIEAFLP